MAGSLAFLIGYVLFLRIGDSFSYAGLFLPTMLLIGVGFGLSFPAFNMQATAGIADHEQGLASGLVNTSLQVGGALGLAIATAVISANSGGATAGRGPAGRLPAGDRRGHRHLGHRARGRAHGHPPGAQAPAGAGARHGRRRGARGAAGARGGLAGAATIPPVAAVDAIETYVSELPALRARRLAHGEWGITVPGEELDGEPLDVGLRVADGLLRAQAVALHGAGDLDPWMLLWWNRQTRLVRFGCTRSRDIWVHADVPGGRPRRARRGPAARPGGRGRAWRSRGLRQPADAG